MHSMEHGPLLEQTRLSAGLDYYKPTMAQVQYEQHPDVEVTFRLKNRGENLLSEYVDVVSLQARLDDLRTGWSQEETSFLGSHEQIDGDPLFTPDFLDYLTENELPPVDVGIDPESGDLEVSTTGEWPLTTFWETVVMSEINEMYFEGLIDELGLDIFDVYDEGDRRLTQKIDLLKQRPDIKFADFGTRRRFSLRWHDHVVGRLVDECPGNIIGTSNVALAEKYEIMPIGTFAHEMPMVYAALAESRGQSPLDGSSQMLRDWEERYGQNLSTALTDTFGTEAFFTDFTPEQAETWRALRHDSGDPIKFGEKVLKFYESQNIDPQDKTIVFSDGLDIDSIIKLADRFGEQINVVFGWGTSLTNDLGLETNNIVMKAIRANGNGTVKLSDETGKYTGETEDIHRVLEEVRHHVAKAATARAMS